MNLVEVMAYADSVWADAQLNPPISPDRQAIAALYEVYLRDEQTPDELERYRADARQVGIQRVVDDEAIHGAARRQGVTNAIFRASVLPPRMETP